VELEDFTAS